MKIIKIIGLLPVLLCGTMISVGVPVGTKYSHETQTGYNADEGRYQEPGEATPYKPYEQGRPSTPFQTQEGFYRQGDGGIRLRQSEDISHAPGYRTHKFPPGDPRAQVNPLPSTPELSTPEQRPIRRRARIHTPLSSSDATNQKFLSEQRTLGNVPFETSAIPAPMANRRG